MQQMFKDLHEKLKMLRLELEGFVGILKNWK
jgi:hypothetical protein